MSSNSATLGKNAQREGTNSFNHTNNKTDLIQLKTDLQFDENHRLIKHNTIKFYSLNMKIIKQEHNSPTYPGALYQDSKSSHSEKSNQKSKSCSTPSKPSSSNFQQAVRPLLILNLKENNQYIGKQIVKETKMLFYNFSSSSEDFN